MFKSIDGGTTWARMDNGLTKGVWRWPSTLRRPPIIYAAGADGVFKSTNGRRRGLGQHRTDRARERLLPGGGYESGRHALRGHDGDYNSRVFKTVDGGNE